VSGSILSLWVVGRMFGHTLPELGKRGFCPLRKHKRKDKTFVIFRSKEGEPLYKCFSCDPPENVGDAVALYAVLEGIDRSQAWKDLRERGYAVPGMRSGQSDRPQPRAADRPPAIPVRGDRGENNVLPLSVERFQRWADQRLGAVARLSKERSIGEELLREHDVVDIDRSIVGFGYRDPESGLPCRVKMRPLDRKSFWIEPRPAEGVEGKALGPLYLADRLVRPCGFCTLAVVTEGELDALSFRQAGINNVVSLPDGTASAGRVDLEPLVGGFILWLSSVDDDEAGEAAHAVLRERAYCLGITVARVHLTGGGRRFKDANEALCAGFGPEDFKRCLNHAAQAALGYVVEVA